MASSTEWDRINRDILGGLDIAAEFVALGIKLGSRPPSDSGWLECHAIDHERSTSAAINVGDGPARGRYRDLGGQGWSLSLWDFAVKFGRYSDWKEARREYAAKAGVKLARGAEPKSPLDQLDFQPWSDLMVMGWCKIKGGIEPEAVKLAGARAARWPKKSREGRSVIALPAFGGELLDADPCGWAIVDSTGASLPSYQGPGKPPKLVKIMTVGGSHGGLINAFGLGKIAAAEVVWKCEGVTDMLALQGAIPAELREKHVCLTNSGGATENVKPEWIRHFAGKRLFIVHDADRPGQLGSKKWVAALYGVASEVRDVQLPYPVAENHGKDLRDYLSVGHTYADVLDMAESTPPARPSDVAGAGTVGSRFTGFAGAGSASGGPGENLSGANGVATGHAAAGPSAGSAGHHQILALLQLDALGDYRDHSVEVFSAARHKLSRIPNVGRMSYADLLQIGGQPIEDFVHEGRTPIPDMYTLAEVKNAIAKIAGDFRLSDTNMLGAGCWRGQPELWKGGGPADEAMPVIVVDSDRAGVWNGAELEITHTPRIGKQILDFEPSERWCDFAKLNEYLKIAEGPWAKDVVSKFEGIIRQWRWKRVEMDTFITVGLALCSWVQTLWLWRPQVFVKGGTNTGKSYLLEKMLAPMYAKLGLFIQKATEAGLRQEMRNRAIVILIDEFEYDRQGKRQAILNLFRTTGRGGRILRGTSNQKGSSYMMQHIPWVGAVVPGLTEHADQNRFIFLGFRKPQPTDVRPTIPPTDELVDLGYQTLAIAIRHVGKAMKLVRRVQEHPIEHASTRVIESFAVPACMLTAIQGGGEDDAIDLMERMLACYEIEEQSSFDETDLLRDIMESHVNLGSGKTASVGQILNNPIQYSEVAESIERHGIALVGKHTGPPPEVESRTHVFFSPTAIVRHCLLRTRWAESKIDEHLLRLPEAIRSRRRLSGVNTRGILAPRKVLELRNDGTDKEQIEIT